MIFRAYDIRGLYGKDIDPSIFYQIGLGTGTYVKEKLGGKKVTVGNDIRKTSETLAFSFIAGVMATGMDVIYTGTSSFGQTLFYGWQEKQDLICFITASHLPAEWNGIKFYYGDGVGLPEIDLQEIRDNTIEKRYHLSNWNETGTIQSVDPKNSYLKFLKNRFHFNKPIRVAVDCGGGSMTLSAPQIFNEIGLDLIPIFCEPDPLFSKRPSEPKPENLTLLVEAVRENSCDFGVAFDGDGDRAVIVDDTGEILSADQTGIILGKYGLKEKQGIVLANVECSKAVDEQLRPLGFDVKQIEVGHTFLTLHAKKENSPLGIESSGHLIIPSIYIFDDALIIPLTIAEILDVTDNKLHDLVSTIPVYPREKLEIPCADEIKFDVIDILRDQLQHEYPEINALDGVRVNLEKGWALVRASNTSPIIRLTVEGDSIDDVQSISHEFKKKTEDIIQDKMK